MQRKSNVIRKSNVSGEKPPEKLLSEYLEERNVCGIFSLAISFSDWSGVSRHVG
jgi:hypothetical protein